MSRSLARRGAWLAAACACLFAAAPAALAPAQEEPPAAIADLWVTKTAAEETAPDADISYAIALTNAGPDTALEATLTDPLPAGTTFVSITQTSGPAFACDAPTAGEHGTVTCTRTTMEAGATAEFTLVVHTDPEAAPGTAFTNVATASAASFDPNEENNAGVATSTVPADYADMGITIQAPESSLPGADVEYEIAVGNGGPEPGDASWELTLPGTMTFVALEQDGGPTFACTTPAVGAGGTVTCTVATLPAEGGATFTLVGHVPSDTPSGSVFTATATVSTSAEDPNEENDAGSTSTTISDADVGVTIAGPASATAGDQITYVLTIGNGGPDAASGVKLLDDLPPELEFVSFTQTSGPAFTLSKPPAGSDGTVGAEGSLPNGGSATFELVVRIDPDTPSGTLSNTATLDAFEADRDPEDNSATASTSVTALPPAAPTELASSPASPANDNLPRITGTAKAGSTVRVYATADCTGEPAATGSAADFAEPGLPVSVADNSTTTFRATASDGGGTSPCSTSSVTYREETPAPAPTGGGTAPTAPVDSPSRDGGAGPPRVTPEPPVLQPAPWLLLRRTDPRTTRTRRGAVRVDTGYVAACPAGGPDCTGRVTLKVLRRSSRGGLLRLFLHRKVPRRTIPAGSERRLVFLLTPRAARLLRRSGSLRAVLRGSIRRGGGAPTVRQERPRIAAYGRS